MELYLIWHRRQCSKLYNVDIDLGKEDYKQASLLEECLFRENIQVVYFNNLLRVMETAQAANLCWNVEYIIRPELREISLEDMEGTMNETIAIKYQTFKKRWNRMEEDIPYPDGECASDMVRRAEPVFMEMARNGCERIVMVTHGGVIRSITVHHLGIPMAKWRLLGSDLENYNITELRWNRETSRFLMERLDNCAHLRTRLELLRNT